MRTLSRLTLCAVAVAALLSGCARGGPHGGVFGGMPQSTFPVYTPNTVTSVGKYDDSAEVMKLGSSFFGTGDDAYKPYIRTQELIQTSASLDDLATWMKKLVQSPPQDLFASEGTQSRAANLEVNGSPAPRGSTVNEPFADSFKIFGLVPYAFWSKDRGRVVMLIIFDPKKVADHLGPTMDVLDQYDKMPALLRGGIDATIKKQVGFSVSDLMDTNTPMGMIVYAARNWRNQDARAIILVDALRGPNSLPTPHNT